MLFVFVPPQKKQKTAKVYREQSAIWCARLFSNIYINIQEFRTLQPPTSMQELTINLPKILVCEESAIIMNTYIMQSHPHHPGTCTPASGVIQHSQNQPPAYPSSRLCHSCLGHRLETGQIRVPFSVAAGKQRGAGIGCSITSCGGEAGIALLVRAPDS